VRHEFGRLAHHLADEVHIAPVNYAVDLDPVTGRRSLLFRTAEGSKLLGVVMNPYVAFEVDEIVGERATSIVLRGRARRSRRTRSTAPTTSPSGPGSPPRSGMSWRWRSPTSAGGASSSPAPGDT